MPWLFVWLVGYENVSFMKMGPSICNNIKMKRNVLKIVVIQQKISLKCWTYKKRKYRYPNLGHRFSVTEMDNPDIRTSSLIRGGSNTKIPNIEHFKHWHTELRTFRTWLLYFKTELRTGKTEHRTFIGINQAWIFDQILGFNFFFRQKNCLLQNVKFCCN